MQGSKELIRNKKIKSLFWIMAHSLNYMVKILINLFLKFPEFHLSKEMLLEDVFNWYFRKTKNRIAKLLEIKAIQLFKNFLDVTCLIYKIYKITFQIQVKLLNLGLKVFWNQISLHLLELIIIFSTWIMSITLICLTKAFNNKKWSKILESIIYKVILDNKMFI